MSISSVSVKARVLACFVAIGTCFLLTNPAYAKSDDSKLASYEKKLQDTKTYGNCTAASSIIAKYKSMDCSKYQEAYENAQKAVENACKAYKDIKSEYKKCTAGDMDKSKYLAQRLAMAWQEAEGCSGGKSSLLDDIDSALDKCKDAIKNQEKADKNAKKTQEKADKAKKKEEEASKKAEDAAVAAAAAAGASARASYNYDEAVAKCDAGDQNACSQVKSLYEAKQDAEKKAKKAADADKKAKEKADSAADKADDAARKNLVAKSEACPGSSVWNQNLQKCSLFGEAQTEEEEAEKITKLGTCTASGATEAKCRSLIKLGYTLEDFEQCGGMGHYNALTGTCDTTSSGEGDGSATGENGLGGDGSALGEGSEVVDTGQDESMDEIIDQAKNEAKGYSDSRCKSVSKSGEDHGTFGIFNYLACKITTVVADIRAIVYILAGFGMIAFAYGAIIGKINFKQLANIFIGLFILSMTTGFIEAVVFNDGTSRLTYGDYLKDGNHGQFNSVSADCSSDASLCPDVALAGMEADANDSSWSFKDLKSSIKSAKNAIKTASDTYKTVKNTVDTAINAAENIGNAIKNGGDITDVVSNIAANVSDVVNTTNMAANQLSNAASSITSDIRDMQSSSEQLAYREELEKQYNILKGKCDTGNCSENEKASLAKMAAKVEENKTKTDKWLENDGKGGGATILAGLGKAAEISNKVDNVTTNVAKAQNEGSGMAGGALGDILGAAYAASEAYTSGTDAYNEMNKEGGALDFRSAQTKAAEDKEKAEAKAKEACLSRKDGTWTWDGKQCTKKDKNGNTVTVDLATGTKTMTKTNEDGSTSTYTQKTNADGSLTTSGVRTDKDGNKTNLGTTTSNANESQVYVNGNVNVRKDEYGNTYVNGQNPAENACIDKGGRWDPKTGACNLSAADEKRRIEACKKEKGTFDPKTKECLNKKADSKKETKPEQKTESEEKKGTESGQKAQPEQKADPKKETQTEEKKGTESGQKAQPEQKADPKKETQTEKK